MRTVTPRALPEAENGNSVVEQAVARQADRQAGGQAESDDDLRVIVPGYRPPFREEDFSDAARRQNDAELADYLGQELLRRVWRRPARLRVRFAAPIADEREVSSTLQAYRDVFRHQAHRCWRDFTALLPRTISLFGLGMLTLYVSNQFRDTEFEETIRHTISDAFQVGGWVLMWTAVAGLFFNGVAAVRNYLAFRRLSGMPIYEER